MPRLFPLALLGLLFSLFVAYRSSLKIQVAIELLGWQGFFNVVRDSAAHRLVGARLTSSREAYHRLLDALSEYELEYCVPRRRVTSEDDIVECERYISHLLSTGFRLFYESDLNYPHFEHLVGPRMKLLGDNPDAFYYSAVIDREKEYVMKGKIQGEAYFGVTVYESACIGCFSDKIIADVNHEQFESSSYEIIISPRPKPNSIAPGQVWLSLGNMTGYPQVITRHYYEGEISAHLDLSLHQELSIRLLDPASVEPQRRVRDAESAERFKRVERFVASHTVEMMQDPSKAPSWFSFTPNVFGPPVLFRSESIGVGAVDIVYSAGPFRFDDPDEQGLLMTGVIPKCSFANIVLWNRLLQTLAYENGKQTSLNRRQMKRSNFTSDLTGSFKILISKRHPKNGLPRDVEWLDSEGREDGTMFWRFILPEEPVERPQAKLVNIDEL